MSTQALLSEAEEVTALDRVISELERLIRADEAALKRQDYTHLAQAQSLKNKFVEKLVSLCSGGIPKKFEKRIEGAIRAQQANSEWLADSMAANIDERASLSRGRGKVRKLTRSYGQRRIRGNRPAQFPATRFSGVA